MADENIERFLYGIYRDTLSLSRALGAYSEEAADAIRLTDPLSGKVHRHRDIMRLAEALAEVVRDTLKDDVSIGSIIRSARDGLEHDRVVTLSSDRELTARVMIDNDQGHRAYGEGFDAYSTGVDISGNPYDLHDDAQAYCHIQWRDGWRDRRCSQDES